MQAETAGGGKTFERELNEKSGVVPRLDMNESQRSQKRPFAGVAFDKDAPLHFGRSDCDPDFRPGAGAPDSTACTPKLADLRLRRRSCYERMRRSDQTSRCPGA